MSFTDSNYKQLQALHEELADSGLRILGFPCNQFGGQEPGTNEEIKAFAQDKYGVKFDMFSKIEVNGNNADPLYKYLKMKQGGFLGDRIKWNFSKFLVDKMGQPVDRYSPTTSPFVINKKGHNKAALSLYYQYPDYLTLYYTTY
ncbi:DgyrCDS5945 [Dimorphilus gyrociliatus]|uniref:Glutathione peroxidase n=1 Tax=Dimorphilus gyrociliatus TaxID=2664684 RepID=A0A7I8VM97_9ANNE|nr:DgyrCDS5945 [Dimorphilus gyrociliatus]